MSKKSNQELGAEKSSQGMALLLKEEHAQAITKFDEAIELYPQRHIDYISRAFCREMLVRYYASTEHDELRKQIEQDLNKAVKIIRNLY